MGTRADFYVGRGKDAEWLGSVAMDGYPTGLICDRESAAFQPGDVPILTATTEADYRKAVADLIAFKRHGTKPEQGWPWPWETSKTTDYAYAFDGGTVYASSFGGPWWVATDEQPEEEDETGAPAEFPDMSSRKNVTMGPRSGLIVFGL